jgi:hypothetical protein
MTRRVALRRDVQAPFLFENETGSLDVTACRRMRNASDVELIVVVVEERIYLPVILVLSFATCSWNSTLNVER